MFDFKPEHLCILGKGRYITSATQIHCWIPVIKQMLEIYSKADIGEINHFGQIRFCLEIPEKIIKKVSEKLNAVYVDNDEGFIIDAEDDITIYSPTDRGMFYGCLTLIRMTPDQYLDSLLAYDYPSCSERGVKVYLPSEKNIEFFKQFVDMLCEYKYNTLMIEVGGAMEYQRHPEINSGWVEYCKEMSEYSGKTIQIQEYTFGWRKNSIHVENGEGGFLSQSKVRELVGYCKERMLEVIPEVPCLSHSDYMLMKHPELAERQEDPYPDTYCPSNPEAYALLFDVLDEVIEVFHPSKINIGHDEYYSIGLCPRCKGKPGEELFAGDIQKIYDYLAQRGIKTVIWAEKLLRGVYHEVHGALGGDEWTMFSRVTGEYMGTIPATCKAMDLVPLDLEILHWYWGFGENLEKQFIERGRKITYGNFIGYSFPNWQERIKTGVKGAMISNWSALSETILQRNGILFNIVFSYFMLWGKNYDDSKYAQVRDQTLLELYHYRNKNVLKFDRNEENQGGPKYLEVLHATDYKAEYKGFVDGIFIEADRDRIGDYIIQYTDLTKAVIPIIYGENIGSRDVSWQREKSRLQPVYEMDEHLMEVSLTTLPLQDEGKTYYRFIFKNPYPEKQIEGISIVYKKKNKAEIFLKSIRRI